MPEALVQCWLERDWGQRDDGYSIHLSEADHKAYVDAFFREEKKSNPSGVTPEGYRRPEGKPVWCEISDELFESLNKQKKKHGLRFWHNEGKVVEQRSKRLFEASAQAFADPWEDAIAFIDSIFAEAGLKMAIRADPGVEKEIHRHAVRWYYQVYSEKHVNSHRLTLLMVRMSHAVFNISAKSSLENGELEFRDVKDPGLRAVIEKFRRKK